jgi:DNA mismatch repair ATPase MutS
VKRPAATSYKTAPIRKERNILFAKFPPDQVPEASEFLAQIEQLEVERREQQRAVGVAYDLHQHSLEELEASLEDKGYHLDNTLMSKMMRALIYYVEETQLHNLEAPERPRKHSQSEAYTHAWERHPHGDHDDTPPEWREYK